ncbi:protein HEG isoform X3 [Trachinotus anak]|uniref:protein HEG isoform X3 n=1 Tax=Trachinotus anak TaxID=443729 RepID=UPI0039F1C46F
MFLHGLRVVFLLAAVAKGMTEDNVTTNGYSNETSTTPTAFYTTVTASSNSSSNTTSSSSSSSPLTTEHFTASATSGENATTNYTTVKPSITHGETTFSDWTTTQTVNSTITDPSAPPTPATPSTSSPETSHPTNTMTSNTTQITTLTLSTEPVTGNATTSPTTSSTGTTTTVTTLQPTEMTTDNSTTAAPPIPTPSPVIVCPFVPCPSESVCLNGTCQCISGSFLQNGFCEPAQVFPGQLHLTSLTFQPEMSNRSSTIFQMTAASISAALRDALKNQQGYIRSDVVQLQPGSVQATVNNIFENTNATQDSVDQAITEAIANSASSSGILINATFTVKNVCEQEPLACDLATTTCKNVNGLPVCSCREGYISNIYSSKLCRACPVGQMAVGDTCQPCAFGYSGFNCNDSALLAVVVISCVLGGILLILLLALLIYCCCTRCSKSKPDPSSSPYSSGDLNQPWPTGITPIPRATTNWDAPSLEMTEGGSTGALVDKNHQTNGLGFHPKQKGWRKTGSYDLNPDGMKTFKGKNPSRYSYLVQGHENPYFLPGDEKKN